jgi:hypothetical protein
MAVPDSTVEDVVAGPPRGRRLAGRGFLSLLLVVVLAGGTGLLGVGTGAASAERAGYRLTVQYPFIARAGLDTTWRVTVRRDTTLPSKITLAITGGYFNIFETQGFHPNPDTETRDASMLYLTFIAPHADTFVLDYDAYIQPSSQAGHAATLALIVAGHRVVSTHFATHLAP